jgi:SNF2 family DNA or RNA helicase
LMPGFLGEYECFRSNYEKPIVKDEDKKKGKQLSQIIAPFVLRRLKKDVLKDLPEKDEQVIYAKLSGRQDELYQAQTQKLIAQLNKQDDKYFKKQRFQVLAAITKLRELCCDPHLLYEDYRGKSAKLAATMELIEDSIADGHKILLFSQFTSMLELIEQKLKQAKIVTFVITGSTPKQKRQELIKQFNKLDHPAIFLISLKAGGTGINLTSADVVIHYDPWWNVAAENQATDRAHRIGQKHNVQIYKMVAKGTIEEKIVELQERKEKLADEVLSGEDFGSSTLDRADLLNILER